MTNTGTQIEGFPRLFEPLLANPEIMNCSVLASSVSDSALTVSSSNLETLTDAPETIQYYDNDYGFLTMDPRSVRKLGTTTIEGCDLLLGSKGSETNAHLSLFAGFRANTVLFSIADFAIRTGYCNYVQLPGEISANNVVTPMEAEIREPILTEIKNIFQESSPEFPDKASVIAAATLPGWDANKVKFAKEVGIMIACSPQDIASTNFTDLRTLKFGYGTAVLGAYSVVTNRFSGLIEACVKRSNRRVRKTFYSVAEQLRDDPTTDPSIWDKHSLKSFTALLPTKKYKRIDLNDRPEVSKLIVNQYNEAFKEFNANKERLLSRMFKIRTKAVSSTVTNGYQQGRVSADIQYKWQPHPNNASANTLQFNLYANIAGMRDTAPTHCGTFTVNPITGIHLITQSGDLIEIDEAHVTELNQIFDTGVIQT